MPSFTRNMSEKITPLFKIFKRDPHYVTSRDVKYIFNIV